MAPQALSKVESVSELRDLQRLMAEAIMRPLTDSYDMRHEWSERIFTQEVVSQFIKPNDRLTSFERIEIYNRQYWFRIIDCLYEDFPGLRAVLGEQGFRKLAHAYLERYPSRSFTLRNLGSRLRIFLEAHPEFTSRNRELALDMARFEWAQVLAFDNEERPSLDLDMLLGRDPAELRLSLQPHLSLLELGFELDDFSIARKHDAAASGGASNAVLTPRARARTNVLRKPKRGRIHLVVHRFDNALYYKRVEPTAFRILSLLHGGATLAAACDQVSRARALDQETFAASIGEWFQTWAELGWFCREAPDWEDGLSS